MSFEDLADIHIDDIKDIDTKKIVIDRNMIDADGYIQTTLLKKKG
tara:strand:- start:590 stop:724 length:135 start_codon:yes stop_codon:yes gene_type:complete